MCPVPRRYNAGSIRIWWIANSTNNLKKLRHQTGYMDVGQISRARKQSPQKMLEKGPWHFFFFFFSIFSFICSLSSFLYLFHFILSQIRLRFSTFVSIVAVRFTLRSPREVTYYFHFQFKHLRERNLIGSVWEKYSSLGQSTGDKKAVWCLKNGSQGCRWGWGTRTVRSIPGELGRYL